MDMVSIFRPFAITGVKLPVYPTGISVLSYQLIRNRNRMISSNDFKTGLTIVVDSNLWQIVEFLHVKPGKGAAFVRSKLRNVETGQVLEKTFRAGEKVETAHLERREMQFLYSDGSEYTFMDTG